MWTIENRGRYDRSKLRYPSDLTDAEWALVAPLIPRAKRGGNKRTVDVREIINGIMYRLARGLLPFFPFISSLLHRGCVKTRFALESLRRCFGDWDEAFRRG
jgi:transposase